MQLPDFREYLAGQGLSRRTIRTYLYHLADLIDWCDAHRIGVEQLTALQISDYTDTRPNSNSSRVQLRSALTYLWQATGRDDPPLKAIRIPPKPLMVCKALDEGDAQLLAKTARDWWPHGAAVLLGLYLALRREEIARARWDRFDPDRGWYTVQGKGSVVATLPVHPVLRDSLEGRHNGTAYLFPGRFGEHMNPATVWTWVQHVAQVAGVGYITPHVLRHTALATANDRTGDLRATQTFARHSRPETTAGYTRTTAVRLREVVSSLDYLER